MPVLFSWSDARPSPFWCNYTRDIGITTSPKTALGLHGKKMIRQGPRQAANLAANQCESKAEKASLHRHRIGILRYGRADHSRPARPTETRQRRPGRS